MKIKVYRKSKKTNRYFWWCGWFRGAKLEEINGVMKDIGGGPLVISLPGLYLIFQPHNSPTGRKEQGDDLEKI